MTRRISLSDFDFEFVGRGHYKVTYTSSVTGKKWTCTTDDMGLIDETKWEEEPTQVALKKLKNKCKHIW